MIQRNKKVEGELKRAFTTVDINPRRRKEEDTTTKQYQEEVQRRIRVRKRETDRQHDLHIEFITSMLPTAMDMHKFTRIMTKDKAFENENGYKVVTAIRTFKDKERLNYLLSNRLSGI